MIHRSSVSGCRTTKIYCRPDCPPGRRTKPENRVYFRSIAEARRKGYRASKVCKPDEFPEGRETIFITRYDGPLGEYFMASSKDGVVCLKTKQRAQKYLKRWRQDKIVLKKDGLHTRQLKEQLDRYFRGKLRRFAVPLDLRGPPGLARQRFSMSGLEGLRPHSLWGDSVLSADRRRRGASQGGKSDRPCCREQSDFHRDSLPPGYRIERRPDRLRRRIG